MVRKFGKKEFLMATLPKVLVQWEYLITRFHRETPHLMLILDPKGEPLNTISLVELGRQGWEMLGFGGWAGEHAFALFKRMVRVEEKPCACCA